jgi:hypothetical protein
VQQHAVVAEGVGLNPVEVKEFGDAFVVGAEQLGVHLVRDGRPVDLGEAMPPEEPDGERQHEHPPHAHFPGAAEQLSHQAVTDPLALAIRVHRDRPDLGQVLPHHVQGPAPDDHAVGSTFGHPEVLHVLVQRHGGLTEQPTGLDVDVHQPGDRPHILGPCPPDRVVHRAAHPSRSGTAPQPRPPRQAVRAGQRGDRRLADSGM